MRDGDIYRAWGGTSHLESKDGMQWQRPSQLVAAVGDTVFKDPSAPDSERYKWVALDTLSDEQFEAFRKKRPDAWDPRAFRPDVRHHYGLAGAVSPDGINWTRLPDPFSLEHSDTQVTGYYDQRLRKYVIYTRNYMIHPTSDRYPGDKFRSWWDAARRSIGRTESDNFKQFPLSQVILEPSPSMEPYDLLYTNCKTTVPGGPDHHLMFPAIRHAVLLCHTPDMTCRIGTREAE